MRPLPVLLSLVVALLPLSCNSASTTLEGIGIPLEDMNSELRLYVPPEANTLVAGDNLRIVAENWADAPIVFPRDYGIRVFKQDGDRWVPIDNAFHYPAGETTLLPKAQEFLGGKPIILHPDVSGAQPVTVRIVVVGERGNRPVAAYVDVTLHPSDSSGETEQQT